MCYVEIVKCVKIRFFSQYYKGYYIFLSVFYVFRRTGLDVVCGILLVGRKFPNLLSFLQIYIFPFSHGRLILDTYFYEIWYIKRASYEFILDNKNSLYHFYNLQCEIFIQPCNIMQKKLSKYQCQIIPKKSWNKITQSFQIPLNNKKYTINV